MPNLAEMPVPIFKHLPPVTDESSVEERSDSNDVDFEPREDSERRGFDQPELNDLARELPLSKKASEFLASRLNEKNLLKNGGRVSYF